MKKPIIITVCLGVLMAVISALPLAWVAPLFIKGQQAQGAQYSGTIWRGQADVPFGKSRAPIAFKMRALALITGQEFLDLSIRNAGINVEGVAGFRSAKDINLTSSIAQLPLLDPRIRGLQGAIKGQISEAKFGHACKEITGQIETNFLQANQANWFWSGPKLAGPIRCDNGDIFVSLDGQDANAKVTAQFRFTQDGVYTTDVDIQASDPRAAIVLGFYGFTQNGERLGLSEKGRWK